MGSTILGSFFLPALPEAAKSAGVGDESTAASATDVSIAERVRRLLVGPVWSEDKSVLVWMEVVEGQEKPVVMCWDPDTDQERADAAHFYEAATWRSWRTHQDLNALLRKPGPWLIRVNMNEHYFFLCTTDPRILFDENEDAFRYDSQTAIQLTSEQALELIPQLMDKWGYEKGPDCGTYLEPVRPEDAQTNFRAQRYPMT
jgi:hypothetical protein